MSHLVCPLCGKNAPLSTLNPENLDLDIKIVSFKGLGYGRGFAKSEEYSILGDEEYSPSLAKKTLQLCSMFLRAGVIKIDDVENTFNISSNKQYFNPTNAFPDQTKESQNVIASLQNRIREVNEEDEIKDEVDYIIREGVEFTNPECILSDSEGWYLKLTPNEIGLELFLYLVVRELPIKLKNRLLPHIKADEDPLWYDLMLKNAPKRKSILESMLDEDREGVILQRDEYGTIHELRYEAVSLADESSNILPMKSLKKIVSYAKNLMNDPDYVNFREKIKRGP